MPQETNPQPELTSEQAPHQATRNVNEARWQAEADAITASRLESVSKPERWLQRTVTKLPGLHNGLAETPEGVMRSEANKMDAEYNEKYKFGELVLHGTMT